MWYKWLYKIEPTKPVAGEHPLTAIPHLHVMNITDE